MSNFMPGPGLNNNVRYVGAVNGCYTLSDRRDAATETSPIYACRLSSISPQQAVVIGPVIANRGEAVVAHFKEFGILRSQVSRELADGFVLDLELDDAGRGKLAAKIRWKKKSVASAVPDKRIFQRIMPRNPRSVLTLDDGTRVPCFAIDISQSGVAVSASTLPAKGALVSVGSMVGRVVRRLDVGFAVEFLRTYPIPEIERGLGLTPV